MQFLASPYPRLRRENANVEAAAPIELNVTFAGPMRSASALRAGRRGLDDDQDSEGFKIHDVIFPSIRRGMRTLWTPTQIRVLPVNAAVSSPRALLTAGPRLSRRYRLPELDSRFVYFQTRRCPRTFLRLLLPRSRGARQSSLSRPTKGIICQLPSSLRWRSRGNR